MEWTVRLWKRNGKRCLLEPGCRNNLVSKTVLTALTQAAENNNKKRRKRKAPRREGRRLWGSGHRASAGRPLGLRRQRQELRRRAPRHPPEAAELARGGAEIQMHCVSSTAHAPAAVQRGRLYCSAYGYHLYRPAALTCLRENLYRYTGISDEPPKSPGNCRLSRWTLCLWTDVHDDEAEVLRMWPWPLEGAGDSLCNTGLPEGEGFWLFSLICCILNETGNHATMLTKKRCSLSNTAVYPTTPGLFHVLPRSLFQQPRRRALLPQTAWGDRPVLYLRCPLR